MMIESDKSSISQPTKLSDSVLYLGRVTSPPEQVWTPLCTPDKFPFTSSDLWERSRNHAHDPKTHIVVTIRARIPIAISTAAIPRIVVPGATPQQLKLPAPSSASQQAERTD